MKITFKDYPIKPGLAATADSRMGKEGILITGQPDPEPNRPFPGGPEASWPRQVCNTPGVSSQTPELIQSYKTGCSCAKGTRQVPAPSLFFILLLACCRLTSAQTTNGIVLVTAGPPVVTVSNLTTNRYTNTLSTLRVEPILTPCPECGKANHHERRVELAEMFDVVYATLVSGGQTNVAVVFKGPKLQSVVTNTVPRAGVPVWRQPGQVTPIPPLTNAPPTP